MNTRRLVWLVLALMLAALALWRARMPAPPERAPAAAAGPSLRIASLTLCTDEILSELVTPDRLVCVTTLADDADLSNAAGFYPAGIPRLRDTDAERIIGLCPDLVCVASFNSADFLKVMERSGLPVYRNEALNSMDQIQAGIMELGMRVGALGRAGQLVERMRTRRLRLADKLGAVPHRPRVLFWSGGFTAGDGSTINDIIREAGGVNVGAERNLRGPAEISPEHVIAADPEFILLSKWSADERAGQIENHPLLRNLPAVREKRVLTIEARYLTTLSHFVVEGAERLAQKLHPERFAQAPLRQKDQTCRVFGALSPFSNRPQSRLP